MVTNILECIFYLSKNGVCMCMYVYNHLPWITLYNKRIGINSDLALKN